MPDSDVRISTVLFNPDGLDVVEGDEYVLIENVGANDVDITGWILQDTMRHQRVPYRFHFPTFVLRAGHQVKVWTGSGTSNDDNLFWGRSWAVWNNAGDIVVLANATGHAISWFSYGNAVPSHSPLLRLATWNLGGPGISPGEDEMIALRAIADCIREIEPEILLLNEVCRWVQRTDQVAWLASELGYRYFQAEMTAGWVLSHAEKCVAILSKFPILTTERIQHSAWNIKDGGYATLHATILVNGIIHHVFSTRFTAYNDIENSQSHATIRDIVKGIPSNEAVIVGGDFNTGHKRFDNEHLPTHLEVLPQYIDFVNETKLRHVRGGIGSGFPDDHLLFRGPYLTVRAGDGPDDRPSPSDHGYVFAELSFNSGLQGVSLEDGALQREVSSPDVFAIYGGAKFCIPNVTTLVRLFGNSAEIISVADQALDQVPSTPCNGTILREETDPRVWLMENGMRRRILSPRVLVRYGGWDAVRLLPDGSTNSFDDGTAEGKESPQSWAEFQSEYIGNNPDGDRIKFDVATNSVGDDTVEFVLNLGERLTWRKELILSAVDHTGFPPIFVEDTTRTAVDRLFRYQLPNASLVLRKRKLGGAMWDVHTLHNVDQLPVGSRVTFTWESV